MVYTAPANSLPYAQTHIALFESLGFKTSEL
jgi:hypothetical protein